MIRKIVSVFLMLSLVLQLSACTAKASETPEAPEEPEETLEVEEEKIRPLNLYTVREGDYEFNEEERALLAIYFYEDSEVEEEVAVKSAVSKYFETERTGSEFEDLRARSIEYYETDKDSFQTNMLTKDNVIVRADTRAVSILKDITDFYGGAHGSRRIEASNWDSETGTVLRLSDVVCDMAAFESAVSDKLDEYWGDIELMSDDAVEIYFEETGEDDIVWSLGYYGVTVFFNPYAIAGYAYGLQNVTVPFDEYPDVFTEKYTEVPDAFVCEMGNEFSYYYKGEEIVLSAATDEEGMYSSFGIYSSSGAKAENHLSNETQADIYAYDYNVSHVHTADGHDYIYLFTFTDETTSTVYVFEWKDTKTVPVGTVSLGNEIVGEGGRFERIFSGDPDNMTLVMTEGGANEKDVYAVGADGLLSKK